MREYKYKLIVKSGVHFNAGAKEIDSSTIVEETVKDIDGKPIVPATALKGKLRSVLREKNNLLSKSTQQAIEDAFNISLIKGIEKEIFVNLIFGFNDKQKIKAFRYGKIKHLNQKVLFLDGELCTATDKKQLLTKTIIKIENKSGREYITYKERITVGTKFEITMLMQGYTRRQEEVLKIVFQELFYYIEQFDYIGANGSKGYGRVMFREANDEI